MTEIIELEKQIIELKAYLQAKQELIEVLTKILMTQTNDVIQSIPWVKRKEGMWETTTTDDTYRVYTPVSTQSVNLPYYQKQFYGITT